MAVFDDTIFEFVRDAEVDLVKRFDADILYFNSEIRMHVFQWFREVIEKLAARPDKKPAIAIFLTTPGGEATAAEKLVEVVRYHYNLVYFVVPVAAMSAGTIFCMSGDKIYMDYSSSLGPIDPQVPDRDGRLLVPALGHLDKLNDILERSGNNTITPVEFEWVMRQDFAMLRFYEQARDLSVALLEDWLVRYKFKDWVTHRTHNVGMKVTEEEKRARAREIAQFLSNNGQWHAHGRMIGINKLRDLLRLHIDDFGQDFDLRRSVRRYNDTLSGYLSQARINTFIYSGSVSAT